jgi:hypothetical protein
MSALSTGERRGNDSPRSISRLHLDFHPLVVKQLDASTPMNPSTPVTPEDWSRTDRHWVQQNTHLARLCCRAAIPLALLAQRTGTTTADAGSIHDTQSSIGFSALFMRDQLLGSLATQRPIGLESKVLAREAASASCASPREGEHSPRREPCVEEEVGEQQQIRSCAPDQDEGDAPVPGASFQTHCVCYPPETGQANKIE